MGVEATVSLGRRAQVTGQSGKIATTTMREISPHQNHNPFTEDRRGEWGQSQLIPGVSVKCLRSESSKFEDIPMNTQTREQ